MRKLIKKILKEELNVKLKNKLFNLLNQYRNDGYDRFLELVNDTIETTNKSLPPDLQQNNKLDFLIEYFSVYDGYPYNKILSAFKLSEEEKKYVISKLPNLINPPKIQDYGWTANYGIRIFMSQYYDDGKRIYREQPSGYWYMDYYNSDNKITKSLESNGDWQTWEYDDKGREIYTEDSSGWSKTEYGKIKMDGNEDWGLDVARRTSGHGGAIIHAIDGTILNLDDPSIKDSYWIEWESGETQYF
jgi:hypothetical protein